MKREQFDRLVSTHSQPAIVVTRDRHVQIQSVRTNCLWVPNVASSDLFWSAFTLHASLRACTCSKTSCDSHAHSLPRLATTRGQRMSRP
eukprot:4783270-Pleurochrysis_carterae.AAC.5